MRTTLTLDDDLARQLKDLARERDVPFKQIVNDTLRTGLNGSQKRKPYKMKPARDLGISEVFDTVKLLQLSGELEDQEILRKLSEGR
jgi:hypothetical protein